MQNLTTTLLLEIKANRIVTLPSGNAKFNWVDVKNIGQVTAKLIESFDDHQDKAFEITGLENKKFEEVMQIMMQETGIQFKFRSINPIRFYFKKKKEGMESGFALFMTILHFLPRFQKEPVISDQFE